MLVLTKEEPLNLSKNAPLATKLTIGVGWDFILEKKIDLDLFAFTDTKEVAYFRNKSLFNGAILCGEDNRDGKGQGIDETIEINLSAIPNNVNSISIALSSYSGENFEYVKNEFCQIADSTTKEVIAKTQGEITGDGKTLTFIELKRENGEWVVTTHNKHSPLDFSNFMRSLGY